MRLTVIILVLLAGPGCMRDNPNYSPFAPMPGEVSLLIHPSACQTTADGPVWNGKMWTIGTGRGLLRCSIPVQAGDSITRWSLAFQRDSFNPFGPRTSAGLERLDGLSGDHEPIGMGASNGVQVIGFVALDITLDAPQAVGSIDAYDLAIGGDGVAGDRVGIPIVHVVRQ